MSVTSNLKWLRRSSIAIAASCLLLITSAAAAQTIALDQRWQLLIDRSGSLKIDEIGRSPGWRNARAGLSWNAQFADLRDYMGVAWYRLPLQRPDVSNGRRVLLEFGAVDYFTEVFVNGKRLGEHEGGYTPFTFDITDALRAGVNELAVRVIDPPMDEKENRARFPEMMYNEIPHGKQNWYVQTGGIWQPVTLRVCPRDCVERVRVTTNVSGQVEVSVKTSNRGSSQEAGSLQLILRNPQGQIEFRETKPAASDVTVFSRRVASPRLWSLVIQNFIPSEVGVETILSINCFVSDRSKLESGSFIWT